MKYSAILVVFVTAACSTTVESACSGYCASELECGAIDREGTAACVANCRAQVVASSEWCASAFRAYAECYDDSASCTATDCYASFAEFAGRCDWYQDEVTLSTNRMNEDASVGDG